MSLVRIRHADNNDAAALAEFGARTFYEAYIDSLDAERLVPFIESTFGVDSTRAELTTPSTTFLIAEAGGEMAGYSMVNIGDAEEPVDGDNPAELARIYVSEEWIGRGVGAELMRSSLEHAKGRGCDVIWLGVWEHNRRAIDFYQRWGFRAIGQTSFRFGDELQTDILMQRPTIDSDTMQTAT